MPQVVFWKLGAVGATGVQLATSVGPLTVWVVQVMVVNPFHQFGDCGQQLATATLLVLLVLQVVLVQLLPELAGCAIQGEGTGTLLVVAGAGHSVRVQLLPLLAGTAVQLATGILYWSLLKQLVVT